MFKVGDEVVCVDAEFHGYGSHSDALQLVLDGRYTVSAIVSAHQGVHVDEICAKNPSGFNWHRFRKVERKSDSLSIEAFLTIKPDGFEEPKRTNQPAKRKEQA